MNLLSVCLGVLKIAGHLCEYLSVSADFLDVLEHIPVDHPHRKLQQQGMGRALAGVVYHIP